MTDRYQTLTVVLDRRYRDDDIKAITEAILMLKGVEEVKLGGAEPDWGAVKIATLELRKQLMEVLWPPTEGSE